MVTMVAMVTGCYDTHPCLEMRQLMATMATINRTPPTAKQMITTEKYNIEYLLLLSTAMKGKMPLVASVCLFV